MINNMVEITKDNYKELKKQLKEFEEKNKRELEEQQRMQRLFWELGSFLDDVPLPQGMLCYPTKVIMSIDYKNATPNFQGETSEHKDITIPDEVYIELIRLIRQRVNELRRGEYSNSITSSRY